MASACQPKRLLARRDLFHDCQVGSREEPGLDTRDTHSIDFTGLGSRAGLRECVCQVLEAPRPEGRGPPCAVGECQLGKESVFWQGKIGHFHVRDMSLGCNGHFGLSLTTLQRGLFDGWLGFGGESRSRHLCKTGGITKSICQERTDKPESISWAAASASLLFGARKTRAGGSQQNRRSASGCMRFSMGMWCFSLSCETTARAAFRRANAAGSRSFQYR